MMLHGLVGAWEGNGNGEFPTIDPFTYREILVVSELDGVLHYRQSTWVRDGTDEVASHQETGFISVGEDGNVAMYNAQGIDRVAVLSGSVHTDGDTVILELESVILAGDDRMLHSWRNFELEGDGLRYTMGMATTQVPDGALHLTARLDRAQT